MFQVIIRQKEKGEQLCDALLASFCARCRESSRDSRFHLEVVCLSCLQCAFRFALVTLSQELERWSWRKVGGHYNNTCLRRGVDCVQTNTDAHSHTQPALVHMLGEMLYICNRNSALLSTYAVLGIRTAVRSMVTKEPLCRRMPAACI